MLIFEMALVIKHYEQFAFLFVRVYTVYSQSIANKIVNKNGVYRLRDCANMLLVDLPFYTTVQ